MRFDFFNIYFVINDIIDHLIYGQDELRKAYIVKI